MKNKKAYFASSALAIAIFGTVIGFNEYKQSKIAEHISNMKPAAAPVVTTTLKESVWVPYIKAIGFIEPSKSLDIALQTSGSIASIKFDSGSLIKKGDELISLDSKVELANLDVLKSQLNAIQSDHTRDKDLLKKGLISQSKYEKSDSALKQLLANIRSSEEQIARRSFIAPFTGTMGLKNVQVGQYVTTGSKVAELENTKEMRVRFTIPQKQLSQVRVGKEVSLTVDSYPEHVFSGSIKAITPSVDKSSGLVEIEAVIPNTGGLLRSGMYADVNIHQEAINNAIVIPQDAISFTMYGEFVYVVDSDGFAKKVQIEVIQRRGSEALVSSLDDGVELIVAGQVNLSNGTEVKRVTEDFPRNQDRGRD